MKVITATPLMIPPSTTFKRIHRVNVGHSDDGQHGQIQNADAAAKITSINRDDQLERRGKYQRRSRNVVGQSTSRPRQPRAKNEQQRRSQHEPRQHAQKSLCGRVQKKIGSGNSAHHASHGQRNHHAPRNIKMFAISAGARRHSHPESDRIGRIRGNRGNSGKQQRGKSDETSAAGDGVERAPQRPGQKKKDDRLRCQTSGVSQRRQNRHARA